MDCIESVRIVRNRSIAIRFHHAVSQLMLTPAEAMNFSYSIQRLIHVKFGVVRLGPIGLDVVLHKGRVMIEFPRRGGLVARAGGWLTLCNEIDAEVARLRPN